MIKALEAITIQTYSRLKAFMQTMLQDEASCTMFKKREIKSEPKQQSLKDVKKMSFWGFHRVLRGFSLVFYTQGYLPCKSAFINATLSTK